MNLNTIVFVMNKVIKLLIIVGIAMQIYLAIRLPIWHDEFYSVWSSDHTFHEIINSYADPVHPPGYFLILHFWGTITRHIYWFRGLSLVSFIINIFLVGKLARKAKLDPLLTSFLYVYSGYFLIFDWQVRMYTLIVTFMLASILIYLKIKDAKLDVELKLWFSYVSINFIGLYLDFAFIWFFVPSSLFILINLFFKKSFTTFSYLALSYVASCLLFILASPRIIEASKGGVNGIEWMASYTKLSFYGPYFLGSHTNVFMTYVFLAFAVFGFIVVLLTRNTPHVVKMLLFSATASLVFTLIYSHYVRQLFHVRSLQVVGLSVIFLYYYFLDFVVKKFRKKIILFLSILLIVSNLFITGNTLIKNPGRVIIDFFPWRDVLNKMDLNGIEVVKYTVDPNLPTKMLIYGLEYTLEGNENIGRHRIDLEQYDIFLDEKDCKLFHESYLKLYACKGVF